MDTILFGDYTLLYFKKITNLWSHTSQIIVLRFLCTDCEYPSNWILVTALVKTHLHRGSQWFVLCFAAGSRRRKRRSWRGSCNCLSLKSDGTTAAEAGPHCGAITLIYFCFYSDVLSYYKYLVFSTWRLLPDERMRMLNRCERIRMDGGRVMRMEGNLCFLFYGTVFTDKPSFGFKPTA